MRTYQELQAEAKNLGITKVTAVSKEQLEQMIAEKKAEGASSQANVLEAKPATELSEAEKKRRIAEKRARLFNNSPEGGNLKLYAPQRAGYVRRWVRDKPGRIQTLENRGYEIVSGFDFRHGGIDGTTGKEYKMALMEIPQEFYQEDQERKRNRNKELVSGTIELKDQKGQEIYSEQEKNSLYGQISIDGETRKFGG